MTADSADTRFHSTRPISRPVASRACRTRRTLWAASSVRARRPIGIAVELGAPLDQLAHVPWTVADEHPHRRVVTQAIAGCNGVGGVQLRRVVVAHGRGNAALRVSGVAFPGLRLGQHQHGAG